MQKGIKVLFVYPNPAMDNMLSTGLSVISACLKNAGHRVKLFDTTFYDSGQEIGETFREKILQVEKTDFEKIGIKRIKKDIIKEFKKMIEDYQPDLIGLTAVAVSFPQGLELLNSIKDINILKIAGGIHATTYPDMTIKEDAIDIICVGEGEDATVELANKIRDGEDYSNVRNLWIKNNGSIIKNPLRPLKNLDDLPFQDWDIYDDKRFYKPYFGKIVRTGGINGQRGCMGSCTFCSNPVLRKTYKGLGKYLRFKSPNRVIEEVKYLRKKYDLQFIRFFDPDFFSRPMEDFVKLAKAYCKLKLPFLAEARADSITQEKVDWVEKMGCIGVDIGVESGNSYIRNKILCKHYTDQQIIDAFKCFDGKDIIVTFNAIIGTPYESREEIFDTIKLNRRMYEANNNVKNSIAICSPYGGTYLRERCIRDGFLKEGKFAGDARNDYVLETPYITKEEVKGLHRVYPMYIRFPKSMYNQIRKAETDGEEFDKLSKVYIDKYLM